MIDISRKHMSTPSLCQAMQPRDMMQQLVPTNPLAGAAAGVEKPYLHPFSNSFLSTTSLEMCTESLATETGSGIDEFPYHYDHTQSPGGAAQPQRAAPKATKKAKLRSKSSFPPPLASISGSGGVQVQTHREGGRLVMKAFTVPSRSSCRFQAERGDGRLRLSLLMDCGGEGVDVDGGDGFGGHIAAEWSSSRCNGDMNSMKRLQSLSVPFWVTIS